MNTLIGTVIEFDSEIGLGVVETGEGTRFPFHCIEIADGTREIAVGTHVTFHPLAKLGHYEAAAIRSR